jgi:hypothetical protein
MTDLLLQGWMRIGRTLPVSNGRTCGLPKRGAGKLSRDKSRCSSGVEHFLGKEEVVSSILINGSNWLFTRLHRRKLN